MPPGTWLDIGCGTGLTTAWLANRFDRVIGFDLAREMLLRAPRGLVVHSDAAALPVPDGCAAAVLLMNAFLFPSEIDRVLARDGVVFWLSAVGADTPIYLPADEAAAALPGAWRGVWAGAGAGTWAVLRRSPPNMT